MCEYGTSGTAEPRDRNTRRFRVGVLAALLPLVISAGSILAQESLDLEHILDLSYPTQIATAESADRVAWIVNESGARNVWTAAPGQEPRRLTAYVGDNGQPLGGLVLTPDGRMAVFVRGGGENRDGQHPNPSSDPAGVDQVLWVVSTDGGEPRKLGAGSSPVVSPSGGELVFSRGGDLFRVRLTDLASGPSGDAESATDAAAAQAPRELEPLFKARGTSRDAVFSPSGDRLAFVSDRGDHSFIGLYDLETGRLSWVAPNVDRDGFPAWSPDGKRLAFIRRDGAARGELFNFLATWPFRILVADAETGDVREVWRSQDDGGGFAQIYPARPLSWVGERLVFFSEDGGWMHIYSVPAEGGQPIDLTPGDCEAEHSDVDPTGGRLVFSHNCTEIDRRQVSVVSIDGGAPAAVGPSEGIHTAPRFADRGRVVYLRSSDALRPTAVARSAPDGTGYRRLQEPDWSESMSATALVEPRAVSLVAADGQESHAQLFEPGGAAPAGGRPALVFMHGGPMRQMLLGWHYMEYYSRCYAFNQFMASRGWVVLSVNFRSGIGYGQAFRLASDQGPYGASEYQDVVAAGRWLAARESVDPNRVALWGGSYGGYLTAMGLSRDSDLFAAGVDLHGVHDWSFRATDFTEGGGWGIAEEDMALALESSPVADVSAWTSPVLLVHGDDDRNVLFQQTTDLVVRLRRNGLEPEILVLPDEVHGFLRHESWLRVFEAAADFLQRHLGG